MYKVNSEFYFLVVNASNADKDFAWVIENNKFDCVATNESDKYSEIALQGPFAEKLLSKHTSYDLTTLSFFTFANIEIDGLTYLVSRTGYTGEDGFEIYGDHQDIKKVWELLLSNGEEFIKPCGLGCRDTLRFEVA